MMTAVPKRKFLSGIALVATLALPFGATHAGDTIKIGGMAPLSSPGSYQQGPELVLGLEWAVADVNAAGGVLGKQVELIVEDTQGRPPTGATVVEKLITKDKVVAAAGEYHSSVCKAEIEVFHQHGIPFVIGSCWSDALTDAGYDEVFRTSVYSSKLAENMVAVMAANGIKKAASLVEDTDYGIGIAKNIENAIKKLNADIDFQYEVVEKTSKDFVPILLKYKTQVKPEVLIVAVTQPGGFLILKQAHEIRFAPTAETLYLDGTCTAQNDKVFWEAVKDAGNYVLMSCPYSPSVKLTDLGEKIKKRYIDKFDRQPNYLPLQGYDAMISLLTAIKNAGSTDSKAIIKALQELKIAGTRGDIEFSQEDGVWHHQWKAVPTFIFQYTKVGQSAGDAAVLFPKQFATAGIARP
ncbi:MAG: ABC transporter substrate-binding protein [Gammaproteobacteria bacterium]|jgi:branched-chain amino acid transport system substrate-binding protein|nr:ABC transporter substrate-binding protein [Gammaproteobacteria bacterium]GIT25957.1 MAG: branched-chain amino acid ABC transporter substrate-binding protein [Gammaproteobacteria bacterium]|tara:strand:+ start:2923 stop:4149 length:1227 start_codon:yes stop_codon:yes gene_type:complete